MATLDPRVLRMAEEALMRDEGVVLEPYSCPKGYLTFGVGRNYETNPFSLEELTMLLKEGPTRGFALFCLSNDIKYCWKDLGWLFPGIAKYPDNVKVALINLRFWHGHKGFRGFVKLIAAVRANDWKVAGDEAMDSDSGRQHVSRMARIRNLFHACV